MYFLSNHLSKSLTESKIKYFYTSCWWRRCFPGVPPVNPKPRTVYNHIDAVIMCSDWDPDPPNILESDKVKFFALNYIIISKQDALWLTHWRGWRLFSGGKFTEVSVGRAYFQWQILFFEQKCEEESGRTGGRMDASPRTAVVFVFLI